MKITILGTGAYSLGIAHNLAKKNNIEIMLWTESIDNYNEFSKSHKIEKIFKDVKFNDNIKITTSFEEALYNTDLIFMITGVKYIKNVCKNILPFYKGTPICIASKGIDESTLSLLSDLVSNTLNTKRICAISGPTFAIDLVNDNPCALAIAGNRKKDINLVKEVLENDNLKLRISRDIIGIELCGSIKNIIAIGSGIISGLGYPESTNAFLINESIHDIKHIIHALGGNKKTILSFAGIGDLLLTCTSTKSRNYSFGYVIGKEKNKNKIEEYLSNNTVEGYYTLKSVYKMLKKKGIIIPLINVIYDIVYNYKNPDSLIKFLIVKP